MIFGNINCNENISSYPKAIQKAINYFKENDLVSMAPGKYELDGDNMILQVLDVETTERCNLRPEVHETYIDVQFLAKGKELIGCYPDMGDNIVDENLLETRDLIFYKNNENARETLLEMQEGSYAVFYPHDVHIPAIIKDESITIRKIVMKIKVSTL